MLDLTIRVQRTEAALVRTRVRLERVVRHQFESSNQRMIAAPAAMPKTGGAKRSEGHILALALSGVILIAAGAAARRQGRSAAAS